MKKTVFNILSLSFITSIIPLVGCNSSNANEGDITTVTVNLDECNHLPFDRNNLLELETNDSSLIYDVSALEMANGKLVIYSGDFIRKFDSQTGKYLGDVSKRGEGPGEYTFISRFWMSGDTLNVWDNNVKKIFHYSSEGNFIGDETPFHNGDEVKSVPQFIIGHPGKGYYTINTYKGGTEPENPRYSFYDCGMNFVRDLPGREMTDGSFIPDRAYFDSENDRVLTWEALKDTLFTLTPDAVLPLYAFDFGKYSFPADKQAIPDYYDRKDAFTKEGEIPWVSYMRCFQVKDGKLYFSFVSNKYENYLGVMDMKTDKTQVYKFEDPYRHWNQQTFFKIVDNEILLACNDTTDMEKNPALYRLPLPLK